MDKTGPSILERAARAATVDGPAAGAGAAMSAPSMLERAAARAENAAPRPVSYARSRDADEAASVDGTVAALAPRASTVGASFSAPSALSAPPAPPASSTSNAPTGPAASARVAPANASAFVPGRGPRRGDIDFARLAARGYVTPDSAQSLTAEEFRLVKRQLLVNVHARGLGAARNSNLILVGSSMPGEGKTFCAINLALSIAAERDLTVLLIDADVSKPEVVSRLGLEGGPGLVDVVADRALDVGDCLIRTNVPNLTVLPAGRPHGLVTELFASERMDDLMQEIARRYTDRVVIFDSPPALVTSAASVLASHVGQVVFVVAAERTREAELKEGLALMGVCPNVQLLLNRSRFFPGGRRFAATEYYA